MRISLRTLILLVTLAAIATPYAVEATPSVIAWWNMPSETELVEEFIGLVDAGKLDEAAEVATLARECYPDSNVATAMFSTVGVVSRLQVRGGNGSCDCERLLRFHLGQPIPVKELVWPGSDSWEEATATRAK